MNLDQAIKKIITDNGVTILQEYRFKSILDDYHAFETMPYAKDFLDKIYKKNYGTAFCNALMSKNITEINSIKSMLENSGFARTKIDMVFNEFFDVFGIQRVYEPIQQPLQQEPIYQQPQSQPTYQPPTYQEPTYQPPIDFDTIFPRSSSRPRIKQTDAKSWYLNSNTSESFERQKREKEKQLQKEKRKKINIILIVIAILLNIPTFFVSGWWLFLTLFLTLCVCIALIHAGKHDITRSYIGYGVMILIFISIFTPIPWWIIIIELIVLGCLIGDIVNDYADL